MRYYSLTDKSQKATFKEATIRGIAPDGGLYFPEAIPKLSSTFFKDMKGASKAAIAASVLHPYIGSDIPKKLLEAIVEETFDFPFPLVQVTDSIFSLELFHGPTLAFKDVGARFMSRCLGFFLKQTSATCYGACSHFWRYRWRSSLWLLEVEGVKVVILYPAGKVSDMQERQLQPWVRI